MSNEFLTGQGVFMKPETAKPILDQIAKQLQEIWSSHTDTTLLSADQQNDAQQLQSLYVTICQEFIGRTHFLTPCNFTHKVPKP